MDDTVLNDELHQPNYVIFRQDRLLENYPDGLYTNTARGGVLIYVHKDLNATQADINVHGTESIWVSIHPPTSDSILIGNCYRPELAGIVYVNNICQMINSIDNSNYILVGDFNFRGINWKNDTASNNTDFTFLQCTKDNYLQQMIHSPTRDKYINDLLLTTDDSIIHDIQLQNGLGNSDHKIIEVQIQPYLPTTATASRKVFLYSRGDYIMMQQHANSLNWTNLLGKDTSLESKWDSFCLEYEKLVNTYVPSKMVRPGVPMKAPWLSHNRVKKSRSSKRAAKIKFKISNLHADQMLVDQADANHKQSIITAKYKYEESIAAQCYKNPRRFYNYARTSTKPKSNIDCLVYNNNVITNDTEKAELLNTFFASVMTKEPDTLPMYCNIVTPPSLLSRTTITEEEIILLMLKLNPHKAIGPDNIHPHILHEIPALAKPLLIIFQQSLSSGILPNTWRQANICAVFKKGRRTDPNNYRPISLTSQVVKIMERIILSRIIKHCKQHSLISDVQHGFMSGSSCLTNLLECLNNWTSSVDSLPCQQTDVIYTDFSKAFDSVPHQRLLLKLYRYGIRGQILDWIKSFLTNRHQRVVANSSVSSFNKVISGVPQGTIMGPILFLLYINDMPNCINHSHISLFADDAKIYKQINHHEDHQLLQRDLDALGAWQADWLLRFNPAKCSVLQIRSRDPRSYYINKTCISNTNTQKDLGITITSDLKPSTHIANICKKANQRIGMIRRCFTNHTSKVVSPLYKSIVRPILETCSPAWNPWLVKDIKRLNDVQARSIKLCTSTMQLESLERRRIKADLCEVYKIINNRTNLKCVNFFVVPSMINRQQDDGRIQTRGHEFKIVKQHCRTDVRKHYFCNRIVNAWNKLSPMIVSAPTLQIFKDRLEMVTF